MFGGSFKQSSAMYYEVKFLSKAELIVDWYKHRSPLMGRAIWSTAVVL